MIHHRGPSVRALAGGRLEVTGVPTGPHCPGVRLKIQLESGVLCHDVDTRHHKLREQALRTMRTRD